MHIDFEGSELTAEEMLGLYRGMLLSRMIEEKMLILLRQGKISKWFSGIGQEAIATGIAMALDNEEYILPMHRNLGVFTTRNIPLERLFAQWQGKATGFTKGRDRSFHFGTTDYKIVGMISHLGPQLGVANGIALAEKLKGTGRTVAVFSGEGGTSEGDFHEALNLAAVWRLPVLFCIENNGYGLSTPVEEQFACQHIADKGPGYGMESHVIDGNNVVEVFSKVRTLAASVRRDPRPVLLEFKTFRMRGHEEASGVKYVPKEILDRWALRDPVENFQAFLIQEGMLTETLEVEIKTGISKSISAALKMAFEQPEIVSDLEHELKDVFHPTVNQSAEISGETKKIRFVDAISDGLKESLRRDDSLVVMGQDIAEYGGVFKITDGFVKEFGKERIRNTPICESGVIEAAYGLSVREIKSVVELQFGDFVTSGFNPVVNLLAKSHYRWGQKADVVLRLPCGAGVGAGPFHSQTNEAWFARTPGLKVVYPAFPADAKGLLCASIADPNPILFFEHKMLYRSVYQEVPEGYYHVSLGKANLLREGSDLTIVAYGAAVHWAIDACDKLNLSADLLDLRTLQPLDTESIFASVRKTGKVIIVQEDNLFAGLASEISARIAEHCFESLDAPVKRIGAPMTPVPFAAALEQMYLPLEAFEKALGELMSY